MNSKLTRRQQDTLNALSEYRHQHGMAPTFRELAELLGVSVASVQEHIDALEAKGIIRRDRQQHRSIEIVAPEMLKPRRSLKFENRGDIR